MYERVTTLILVVLLGPIMSVRADKLILHDGRILSGQVTVDKGQNLAERTYRIVTDDGRTLTFPKDEVKRHKHECRLSDTELQEKFDQWQRLVKPVLDTREPLHREFLTQWRHYTGSIMLRDRLWEKTPDSRWFRDEWAVYAAEFRAVGKSLTYKNLLSAKKGSNSLKEYSRFPPEGREVVAEALKFALESFEECIKLAHNTTVLVENLPKQQIQGAKKVRNRQNKLSKARSRRSTDRDYARRRQDNLELSAEAERRRADVEMAIRNMRTDLEESLRKADRRINDFTRERAVTFEHMAAVRRETVGLPRLERLRTSPSGVIATPLPSGAITREFRRLVKKHREDAVGLTTVGLKALRESTRSAIEELFVGQQFSLQLQVDNIEEAGADGYRLIADHRPDLSDTVVRTVEFDFDGGVRHHLIRCKVGAGIEVAARIKRVRLTPGLKALETTSDVPAHVRLTGDVVSVRTGCGG